MELFDDLEQANRDANRPLAARLRPQTLDDFVGQRHFLGEGKLLRRMLLADRVQSLLFYGPPGTGKTTLAHLIARHTRAFFVELNAVAAGTKEVRAVLSDAEDRLSAGNERTLLFLDEIHRFHRGQQDVLLPAVEQGTVVLIGATTQNPFFAINAPLISRSQIFQFQPLTVEEIESVLHRATVDRVRGLGKLNVTLTPEASRFLAVMSDGDARRALNALEIAVRSFPVGVPIVVDPPVAAESIQRKATVHDPTGDEHFDLASALIKSMRGSDPDAAVYWLARMLESGEDPRFLARRIVIFASEDIGLADVNALPLATAAQQAVEFVGLPECQLTLSHAVIYMATAPKSNSATKAINEARRDVAEGRTVAVPAHLRDKHYSGAKQLGHGEGYRYPHDFAGGHVDQEYLPGEQQYYFPSDRGDEIAIRERLAQWRSIDKK